MVSVGLAGGFTGELCAEEESEGGDGFVHVSLAVIERHVVGSLDDVHRLIRGGGAGEKVVAHPLAAGDREDLLGEMDVGHVVGVLGDDLVEAPQRGEAGGRGAFCAGERHDGGCTAIGIRRAGIRTGDDIGQGLIEATLFSRPLRNIAPILTSLTVPGRLDAAILDGGIGL